MKMLRDFLPILIFFVVFKVYDIYAATIAAIAISALQVGHQFIWHRKVDMLQWMSLLLIATLGGATLFFQNPWFIKFKPSAVYCVMGLVFLLTPLLSKRSSVLEGLLSENIALPENIWRRLNTSWVLFFFLMATLNAWVATNFDTVTWVNFKLFGALGLTLIFILIQAAVLSLYASEKDKETL